MSEHVKVVFTVKDGPPEIMWALPVADDLFVLDNMPWFVYDISLGDVFSVKSVDGDVRPHFDKVIARSGNRTYRIVVRENVSADQRQQVADRLLELSLLAQEQRYSGDCIAFTAEANAQFDRIEDILEAGETTGLWDWELSSPEPLSDNEPA